jgi:hypothetical protein
MPVSRSGRRSGLVVTLVALLLFGLPASASGATFSVSSSIRYGACTSNIAWKGDVPNDNAWDTQYYQSYGTVKFCFTVLRLSDSDSTGDYWAVSELTTWNTTQGSYAYPSDNYGKVRINSTIGAISNYRFAAPDHNIELDTSCSAYTSLSVSAGFVSVGLSEKFCSGGRLNLEVESNTAAQWGSPDVTRTRQWETAFVLKVPNGGKPKLSGVIYIPNYYMYRDSTTLYWKYAKQWVTRSFSYQVP